MSKRLPNGWVQPTFMSVDTDGSLHIEWCFDDERLMFVYDPVEGVMACSTGKHEQIVDESNKAALTLAKWLDAEAANKEVK